MKTKCFLALSLFILTGCESYHPLFYNATSHSIVISFSTRNFKNDQINVFPGQCFGMIGIAAPSIVEMTVTDYRGVRHQYSDLELSNLRSSQTNGELLAFNNDGLHPLLPGMTGDPSGQLSSCGQ